MKLLFDHKKTEFFDIHRNGIQLIDRTDTIEIYNDPFRTVPLFITKNKHGELIVFSEFEDYYDFESVDRSIDEVGFWEIIFFGSGLWSRTLYKNVKQMPAATCIKINKEKKEFSIERYWNFDIHENHSIQSIEQAADGLYLVLDSIFSDLDKKRKYLLGMSGGMDSRITLAFLSKHIPKDNIKLFTYGFDENILEYVYAKEIACALDLAVPNFHQLDAKSYKDTLNYLPSLSGGQISINHCHIIDFFKKNSVADFEHISTYFSDAVFGWDCKHPKKIQEIRFNYYAEVISNNSSLNFEIKNEIINDALKIFNSYDPKANFSSLDEFKYVTERNQKFHMLLASIQGRFSNTQTVYANLNLLKYCISVPIKFRQNKNLIDALMERYFPKISSRDFKNVSSRDFKNVSSRFQWGSKYAGYLSWYHFRALNGMNSILRILTHGEFQLNNIYQTEEHERLLHSIFKSDLHIATSKLSRIGLLSSKQKEEFDRLPIRSEGIAERYALISLAKLM